MKCGFCGYKNKKNVSFCGKCGTPLYNPKEENTDNKTSITYTTDSNMSSGKNKHLKKILMFVISIIVVITLLKVLLPRVLSFDLQGSNYLYLKDYISFFSSDDVTAVSCNNDEKYTIDGERYSSRTCMDGGKAAVLVDYDDENDSGGTLWYVTTSGKIEVENDVEYYVMANSGNGIAYITDYDDDTSSGTLYLYDCKTKKSTKISDDVSRDGINISPNGKSIGYQKASGKSSEDIVGYVMQDGKSSEKLGNNKYSIAISDNAKYVYYAKTDGSNITAIYVRNGDNETKLASGDDYEYFFLNYDYSQIIFSNNGKSYISLKGKEKEKISNSNIDNMIVPRFTQAAYSYNNKIFIISYGIKSFANTVSYTDNSEIIYLNKKFQSSKVTTTGTEYGTFSIASNNKDLFYIDKSSNLCKINIAKENSEKVIIGKNAANFITSSDGKIAYFVNEDDELWYVKGTSKPVKISDDVYQDTLTMSVSGSRIYFLVDYESDRGTLYYSENGGKKVKVKGANDVYTIYIYPKGAIYLSNYNEEDYSYDVYRSNGNENFSSFVERTSY